MSRLIVVSCFACLSLVAACVDTSQPAVVAGGSGGKTGTGGSGGHGGTMGSGGTTVGSGGTTAGSGGTTVGTGGRTAGAGGGTAGAGGGTACTGGGTGGGIGGTGGGTAGAGGATDGGVGGTGGGGSTGSSDASSTGGTGTDAPHIGAETGISFDLRPPEPDVQQDGTVDAPNVGTETGGPESGPEPGPDAPPDIARDLPVDLTPDIPPPPHDTGVDAGNCVQRFKTNGYSLGTDASIAGCSSCKDSGGNSLEQKCIAMINCLQPLWPCSTSDMCWTNCGNAAGADGQAQGCVATLTTAACR